MVLQMRKTFYIPFSHNRLVSVCMYSKVGKYIQSVKMKFVYDLVFVFTETKRPLRHDEREDLKTACGKFSFSY